LKDDSLQYNSDTSDEEAKYLTKNNKYFWRFKKKQFRNHTLRLWRKCYLKLWSVVSVKAQLDFINTKIGFFGVSMGNDNSQGRIKERKIEKGIKSMKYRIHPESKELFYWNLLNIFIILYNSMASPYRVAFHSTVSSTFLIAWEWLNELIFLLDIFISFLTPYYNDDGTLQMTFSKIRSRYLDTFIATDIIAAFPL
jgi:hypothetical protein